MREERLIERPAWGRAFAICSIALVACGVVGILMRPVGREVVGISMGPGLLPGDVIGSARLPLADRFRRPSRYERWIVRDPEGGEAVKRLIAGDGESLAIEEGDLVVDGRVLLKSPRELAEMASGVQLERSEKADSDRAVSDTNGEQSWRFETDAVYDDAIFAPKEKRWLLEVRDVGITGIVSLTAGQRSRLCCRVGDHRIGWSVEGPGGVAFIAGRLDRHLVAVAWHATSASPIDGNLPDGDGHVSAGGPWFPADLPEWWSITESWHDGDMDPLPLGIDLSGNGASIAMAAVWRDGHHLPAQSGRSEWSIPRGEWFFLGDHPPASVDSRTWGPLGRERLLHRVTSVRRSR